MFDFAFLLISDDFVQRFSRLDRSSADLLVAGTIVFLQINLRKESSHLVVLILRPTFERMVMAFVAIESRGEEQVRRVLHRVLRISQDLEVRRSRVVHVGTGGRQDLAHELIVRRVFLDLAVNPLAELLRTFFAKEFSVHLQKVRPFVRPVIDVGIAADQFVDQFVTLPTRVTLVVYKVADRFGGWRKAG